METILIVSAPSSSSSRCGSQSAGFYAQTQTLHRARKTQQLKFTSHAAEGQLSLAQKSFLQQKSKREEKARIETVRMERKIVACSELNGSGERVDTGLFASNVVERLKRGVRWQRAERLASPLIPITHHRKLRRMQRSTQSDGDAPLANAIESSSRWMRGAERWRRTPDFERSEADAEELSLLFSVSSVNEKLRGEQPIAPSRGNEQIVAAKQSLISD